MIKIKFIFFMFCALQLVKAQNINFADPILKNYLLTSTEANYKAGIGWAYNGTTYWSTQPIKIDANDDGEIQTSEVQNITFLNIAAQSITNLGGLEHFTNLKRIRFQLNYISSFNFSMLSQLEYIECFNNQLTSLNLSYYPNLKELSCRNNQLTSLDFRYNPQFTLLKCQNNNLTTLYIKNNAIHNFNDFYVQTECWSNNPNLSYICADASEIPALQSFLTSCGYNLSNITIDSNCALSEHSFSKNVVKVFPNPSNTGVFSVELPVVSKGKAMVYNALGQKVYENNFVNQTFTLPLNFLPKNTYFLKLITENQEVFDAKILIE